MKAIFKRELASHLHGVPGWLFIALMILFAGLFISGNNLLFGMANLGYSLNTMNLFLAILCPLFTMRSLTEERRSRTEQLLFALPLSMGQIVCGKYFALLALLGIPTAVIGIFGLILRLFGEISLFASLCSLLSFFLLGAALLALCLYISSKTEHLLVSAIVSLAAVAFLYVADALASLIPSGTNVSFVGLLVLTVLLSVLVGFLIGNKLAGVIFGCLCAIPLVAVRLIVPGALAGLLPRMLCDVALFSRYVPIVYGVMDLSTWVMDLSFAAFFLLLTVLSMEKRRYA